MVYQSPRKIRGVAHKRKEHHSCNHMSIRRSKVKVHRMGQQSPATIDMTAFSPTLTPPYHSHYL